MSCLRSADDVQTYIRPEPHIRTIRRGHRTLGAIAADRSAFSFADSEIVSLLAPRGVDEVLADPYEPGRYRPKHVVSSYIGSNLIGGAADPFRGMHVVE